MEHHLADIFTRNNLVFEEQVITENRKKLDFVFPNGVCYHDICFPADGLIVLGVKTTCKDRWRQVLTEADRVDVKYLFTMQQGISKYQLKEMQDSRVVLVAPSKYISSFPSEFQGWIKDLSGFIHIVHDVQEHLPRHYLMK